MQKDANHGHEEEVQGEEEEVIRDTFGFCENPFGVSQKAAGRKSGRFAYSRWFVAMRRVSLASKFANSPH